MIGDSQPGSPAGWMLLLNTCGNPGEVGLADLSQVSSGGAASLNVRQLPGRETQERLLPEITLLLDGCGVGSVDVRTIAVVNGPGSFTGVRVGLAAAMGLAEALQIPVVQVSRLAVLAAQADDDAVAEAWLQAGRSEVFRGRYRGEECLEEAMLRASDALAELPETGAVVAEEELLALSQRLRLVQVGLSEVLPLALRKLQQGESIDAAQVEANYLRVPDAELALRARMAAQQVPG